MLCMEWRSVLGKILNLLLQYSLVSHTLLKTPQLQVLNFSVSTVDGSFSSYVLSLTWLLASVQFWEKTSVPYPLGAVYRSQDVLKCFGYDNINAKLQSFTVFLV